MNSNHQRQHGDMSLHTLERFFRSTARHFDLRDETAVSRALAPFFADEPEEGPPDRRPRHTSPGRPPGTRTPRPAVRSLPHFSRRAHARHAARALWGGHHG